MTHEPEKIFTTGSLLGVPPTPSSPLGSGGSLMPHSTSRTKNSCKLGERFESIIFIHREVEDGKMV